MSEYPDTIKDQLEATTGHALRGWSAWNDYLARCNKIAATRCAVELCEIWKRNGRDPKSLPNLGEFQELYGRKYKLGAVSGETPIVCAFCAGRRSVTLLGVIGDGEGDWRKRFQPADLDGYCYNVQTLPLEQLTIQCPCSQTGDHQTAFQAQWKTATAVADTFGGSPGGALQRVYGLSRRAIKAGKPIVELLRASPPANGLSIRDCKTRITAALEAVPTNRNSDVEKVKESHKAALADLPDVPESEIPF